MKGHTEKLLVTILCTILLGTSLFSQSLPFKHYAIKEGLASSSVNAIFQDDRGFLWVGTQNGISRFNGLEFKNFTLKDGLPNDYIACIHQDIGGNLWFGTMGGLVLYRQGQFQSFTVEEGLPNSRIHALADAGDGDLWVGTEAGLYRFNGKSFSPFQGKHGMLSQEISSLLNVDQNKLWIGTSEGLSFYDGKTLTHYTMKHGLPDNFIATLARDSTGTLWVGTPSGLARFNKGDFTTFTSRQGLVDDRVNTIVEDVNQCLWIGTSNGVSVLKDGEFTQYTHYNGLPSNKIYTIITDREGNLWFGTIMGLSRLHSLRLVNYTVNHGLAHNLVWTMLQDRQGRYWFGTDRGLTLFANNEFSTFTTKHGLSDDSIYKLLQDKWGNIWIATQNGLSLLKNNSFTTFTTKEGLPHNTVLSLAEDKEGRIWVGTQRGLCCFVNGNPVPLPFPQVSLPTHIIIAGKDGCIWFCNNRLYRFHQGALSNYSYQEGLIDHRISSLMEDSRGRIWIGTHNGLSIFDGDSFINMDNKKGLSNNICYFLVEDNNKNIWIGTGRGINRFDGKEFRFYTSRDGLPSDETCQGACLRDNQGHLWFGTTQGLARFNPGLDRDNTVPPPAYLTNFSVFGATQAMNETIELKHNRNYLTFSFTGISLTSPKDMSYMYKLESIDREWHKTTNTIISYPYLPPGDYVFKVKAVNNHGVESENPAFLPFVINPPFWQTLWFQALMVLAIISISIVVVLWRIRKAREKIANEARNKQLVMAQKMELLGILAAGAVHDLKNLLAVIIGYSKIAVRQVEQDAQGGQAIEKIKTTAGTAIQVVKQILAFTRQKHDQSMAANLPDLLDDILDILKVTTPAEIRINWQPPDEEIRFFINPTRFQQILMNLCINAIQAMPQGGNLDISMEKEEDGHIRLIVADSGMGMDEETRARIFDPLFTTKEPGKGTGLGLFVVKQILEECNGKIEVQSQLNEGTRFTITFPPN